jgi:nucleotide-binding universal stress UspA family protein
LDGSETGEAAVPYVEQLLSKISPAERAEVTLLGVVSHLTHYVVAGESSALVPYTDQEVERMKNETAEYLNGVAGRLKGKAADVKVRVALGEPAEEIIKAADDINADLIAMSTHGRSGISRWAFGSVTDKVLRAGNRPMLVVRASK